MSSSSSVWAIETSYFRLHVPSHLQNGSIQTDRLTLLQYLKLQGILGFLHTEITLPLILKFFPPPEIYQFSDGFVEGFNFPVSGSQFSFYLGQKFMSFLADFEGFTHEDTS